ncbi:MAG: TetR/AcrR family transcriptional regulator [Rhizomicrobium sp.]
MKRAEGAATRRMGPAGSVTWSAMLDGAEDILREEGYAALTSRRIAERIGVKQRLVYYYFRTMDDLIIETFRRLAVRELERLAGALASERPLREIWDVCIHTSDARLVSEFMALANRIDGLRTEVISFIKKSRRMQVAALSAALKGKSRKGRIPPVGLAILANSVALTLNREGEIGVKTGHAEIMTVISDFLAELEPD